MEVAAQYRPRLGAKNQVLGGTRTAPIANILVNGVLLDTVAGTRGAHQAYRIAHDGVGYRHAANQFLQTEDFARLEHGPNVGLDVAGGALDDSDFLVRRGVIDRHV